ncbi:MAG: VWA domain-containing protein [Planctomycetia bacterium]|nr:VWA domain-containing protein [Planctomycetia bacterium]
MECVRPVAASRHRPPARTRKGRPCARHPCRPARLEPIRPRRDLVSHRTDPRHRALRAGRVRHRTACPAPPDQRLPANPSHERNLHMITNGNTLVAPEMIAEFDRTLVNTAGGSVRHLVVTIRAPRQRPAADEPRTPLNLGLILDASGSMAGRPLAATKAAALNVVAALPETDHLTLVSFAEDVQLHAEAVRLDAEGRALITTLLRSLDTRGSTNLADGWLGGCDTAADAGQTRERAAAAWHRDLHRGRGPQLLAHAAAGDRGGGRWQDARRRGAG